MRDALLHSLRTVRLGALALYGASLSACALQPRPALHGIEPTRDTSAFVEVLKTILTDTTGELSVRPMHVDPRPLRNDRQVWEVSPTSVAPATHEEIEARKGALSALGIVAEETDIPANCGGTLRAPDPREDPHRGCPLLARIVIAVSRPRRGDESAATGAVPDSSKWTSRVLVTAISSGGVSVQARDYVIERSSAGWTFVRMRVAGWVE